MLRQWEPVAAAVTAVPLRSARSLDPEAVRSAVSGARPFLTAPDVASALAGVQAERVVVAGSLWLVGEARAVLAGEPLEEVQGVQ